VPSENQRERCSVLDGRQSLHCSFALDGVSLASCRCYQGQRAKTTAISPHFYLTCVITFYYYVVQTIFTKWNRHVVFLKIYSGNNVDQLTSTIEQRWAPGRAMVLVKFILRRVAPEQGTN